VQDELGKKQFFVTPAHPCSYLPGRDAQTLFFDPRETITTSTYQRLTEIGFRRSGSHLYRPHCATCNACIPSRLPVAEFRPNRRQRRVERRNDDIVIRMEEAAFTPRHYDLYSRYIAARHRDGDMYPPSRDQFRSFLLSQWSNTVFLSSYLDDELVSVAVTDYHPGGLSAIYTFFDPALATRSLGVFSILRQVRLCRELDAPHLYLGYWIRECDKMRYKADYRPVELLINERWTRLD
jgi:arginine-tRNA-protein transferase